MKTFGKLNTAIYRNMQHLLHTKLHEMNIGNGQYDFFYVISKREGISQKELSEDLHIGKSTTAKAVRELTEKGYIRKEKDLKDGRIDHLYLTDKGKQIVPIVHDIFHENLSIATKGLSKEETKNLLILLEKVLENVSEEAKKR